VTLRKRENTGKLKEEALEPILWRTRFVLSYESVVVTEEEGRVQRQGVEETIYLGWRRKRERCIMRSFKVLEPRHILIGRSNRGGLDGQGTGKHQSALRNCF
jgi:hypothetical protein